MICYDAPKVRVASSAGHSVADRDGKVLIGTGLFMIKILEIKSCWPSLLTHHQAIARCPIKSREDNNIWSTTNR